MKALVQYQNHKKELKKELKEFVNGMDTPNINALSNKIEHMCENIGSPLSVTEMLQSICNDVVKKWGGERGNKQLGICDKSEAFKNSKQNDKVIVGHFRWDFGKAFLLTDKERRYTKMFYFGDEWDTPKFNKDNAYDHQAISFLKSTNTTIRIKLIKKAKYFSGDNEERNVYQVEMKNSRHEYLFTFGDSINNTKLNNFPTSYDILTCLTKYDPNTFENFCSDFGYDEDSREAEKTYSSVVEEYKNVIKLFTPEQLEELSEIQ